MDDVIAMEDCREEYNGWIPGTILNFCVWCNNHYWGDRNSRRCACCAYADIYDHLTYDQIKSYISEATVIFLNYNKDFLYFYKNNECIGRVEPIYLMKLGFKWHDIAAKYED